MIGMKKFLSIFFLLISFTVSAQLKDIIARPPNPPRLINDYTKTLTAEQLQALEQKMVAYDDSTSNQVVIVIVSKLEGKSLEDAALEILRNWGVGGKENNNGVVILVAKDDRKVTIQMGYGLEGVIPDVTAKAIIDNAITPNFKKENYYRGLDEATDDIIKAAAGRYKAPEGYGKKSKGRGIGLATIIFILILIFAFSGRGGGGGGMVSRRGYRDFGTGWILGTLLGGGGGGGGGGGWSGGGGGGGGFGGFGGGSGGGGGASGSW